MISHNYMLSIYMHPSVAILEVGGQMGKGVFALQDIPADQNIVYVCSSQFIIYELMQYYQFEKLQVKDQIILFALYLSYIQLLPGDSHSKFNKQKKYLSSLPSKFDNLICWSSEQLQMLNNQILISNINSKKQAVINEFQSIKATLISFVQQNHNKFEYRVFSNKEQDCLILQSISIDSILRIYSVIESRNLYYTCTEDPFSHVGAIVPLIQMFNHSNDNQISVQFTRQKYYAKTMREVKKGQQLFVKYGNYSDQQFMKWYGFLPGKQRNFQHSNIQKQKSKNKQQQAMDTSFRKKLAEQYKKRRQLK